MVESVNWKRGEKIALYNQQAFDEEQTAATTETHETECGANVGP